MQTKKRLKNIYVEPNKPNKGHSERNTADQWAKLKMIYLNRTILKNNILFNHNSETDKSEKTDLKTENRERARLKRRHIKP